MATDSTRHSLGGEVDLGSLLGSLWRAKVKIILFVLLVVFAMIALIRIIPPEYTSEARILLEPQETPFTRPEAEGANAAPREVDEQAVTSQVQVISSRDVAEAVIEELDLLNVAELDPAREGPGLVESILVTFGLANDPMAVPREERVYMEFSERLSAYNIRDSRVIVVEFTANDAQLAARVTNAIVEHYITGLRDASQRNTRSATTFLDAQITDLRTRVASAEADVARFRATSDLAVGVNNTTISAQQLSELSTQLTRAEAEVAEAQARAEEIRSILRSGGGIAVPEVLNSPLFQRLQEQQVTLRARIAELSATLLPQHPRIRELNAQLADLNAQIRSEANRIASGFENEARVARARAQELDTRLGQLKAEAARVGEAEVELRALEREAAAQRELLESYLARYREAAAREADAQLPPNARSIQLASANNVPVSPKPIPLLAASFIGSLLLSIMIVLSSAILSGRAMREPSGPQDDGGRREPMEMPHMAPAHAVSAPRPAAPRLQPVAAPALEWPRDIEFVALDDQVALRRLLTSLRGPEGAGSIVLVTDSGGGHRSAGVALGFARGMAAAGRSVVMVDGQGEASAMLALQGPGLSDLCEGTADVTTAISRDPMSRAHVVVRGYGTPDVAAAGEIVAALSESYDCVIFVSEATTTAMLAQGSDVVALAAASGHNLTDIRLAEVLSEAAPRVVGVTRGGRPQGVRATTTAMPRRFQVPQPA